MDMDFFKQIPVEIAFVLIAFFGGIARYLNGFTNGVPFKLGIFIASGFVAGFSGWMFALFGETLQLPQGMLFVMAGTGGFFGEQTLKFIMEQITKDKK
jgi:hypothetical protein